MHLILIKHLVHPGKYIAKHKSWDKKSSESFAFCVGLSQDLISPCFIATLRMCYFKIVTIFFFLVFYLI